MIVKFMRLKLIMVDVIYVDVDQNEDKKDS